MQRLPAISILVLALSSCGGDDQAVDEVGARAPDPSEEVLTSNGEPISSLPVCDEILVDGAVLPEDLDETGCADSPTMVLHPGIFECDDGRKLLGGEGVAGYLGEEARAMTPADEEYADLHEECNR